MNSYPSPTDPSSQLGEPTWEIAHLFPAQGHWSESEFLALESPHRFELHQGKLELLPMATLLHQLIGMFLCDCVREYLKHHPLGICVVAPLFVRLGPDEIRQPDVIFLRFERIANDLSKIQNGADLVMEVVSSGKKSNERDWVDKRAIYAAAGIAEYWVVDPEKKLITVFALEASAYRVAGEYREGVAASVLLPGFAVDVLATFAAGELKKG